MLYLISNEALDAIPGETTGLISRIYIKPEASQ